MLRRRRDSKSGSSRRRAKENLHAGRAAPAGRGRPRAARQPPPWHALPAAEVLERLGASRDGLSSEEAERRLSEHGPNRIRRASRAGPLRLLFRQINSPLIYVLLGSAALAFFLGKGTDGAVVLAVVVLNTVVGFVQEYRAERAIEELIGLVPEQCTVRRDGGLLDLPVGELVPGDLVLLDAGDKVPADLRLLSVKGLQTDEALLTGESGSIWKRESPVAGEAELGDRTSLAHSGTLVTAGSGGGVVVATGNDTELGRISSLLQSTSALETPLTRSLDRVGRWLTVAILAVAAALFAIGRARGYGLLDATLAAITLAVAAIPEGLPAIITIALAIGVRRMARRRAVIRRLPAVETLGSTTVICTDKTGTLTRNEMTVQALWSAAEPGRSHRLGGIGYAPQGELTEAAEAGADAGEAREAGEAEAAGDELRSGRTPGQRPASSLPAGLEELIRAGLLCNDASLRREEGGRWTVGGDPTEGALLVAGRKLGLDEAELAAAWPRLDTLPFSSERQLMATLHRTPEGGRVVYLKGAPEVVIRHCRSLAGNGPSTGTQQPWQRVLETMTGQGLRVLAMARRTPEPALDELPEDEQLLGGDFTLLGLQGMIDPPRPEAVEAVQACRRAGITVKMITGDHPGTARAIGEQLGLLSSPAAGQGAALSGRELASISDEAGLQRAASATAVFARVAPEHKLRLVEALQASGEVVAMTGDGVNDAPALRRADIGIAMGLAGTSVAKEAAAMVLTDDNFATIAAAVEEGRHVYDNLLKSLAFILPTNLGEALIIGLAVLFFPFRDGQPLLPVLPVQVLWINLVATVTLALPLAFEAMEPELMRRPPRRPDAPLLGPFVLARTGGVALLMTAAAIGLFFWDIGPAGEQLVQHSRPLQEAQTMVVNTVVLFQIFYLFACRSLEGSVLRIGLFSNPAIYLGIGLLLALQLAFVYLPPMHRWFGSAPLDAEAWGRSALVASSVLPLVALEKRLRRRWKRRSGAGGGGG